MNISTKTRADDEFFTIEWRKEGDMKREGSQHDLYGQFPGCQRVEEKQTRQKDFGADDDCWGYPKSG
jgi:hypothetical protein